MPSLIGRVALQLWIVAFLTFFGAESIHLEPTLRVVTQVLYAGPLVVWAALRLRGPWDELDVAVVALLTVYAIAAVLGVDRTESLNTLGIATALATIFLLGRRLGDGALRTSVISGVATGLTLTLAFNAYLLIEEKVAWVAATGQPPPFEGFIVFPWQSVNALPILVLLAIPFLAWSAPGTPRTAMVIVSALSAVVVVPLSVGRAGWLGLAVALVAYLLITPYLRNRIRTMYEQRPRPIVLAGALAAVAFAVMAVVATGVFVRGLGESGRFLLWQQGIATALTDPATGLGGGSYSWARLAHPPFAANLLNVPLVHNTALLTFIEGGLLVVAAFAATLVLWLAKSIRHGLAAHGGDVALAVAAGYATTTLLDDLSFLPAVTVVALLIGALLAPIRPSSIGPRGQRFASTTVVAVLVACGLLSLPSVAAVDSARASAQAARTAAVDGDWMTALREFRAATASHPENGGYWLGRGMAASHLDLDAEVVDAYERAAVVSPGESRAYAALAARTSDGQLRLEMLATAVRHGRGDPQFAVWLGIELAANGDSDGAVAAWGQAAALDPAILRSLPVDDAGLTVSAVARSAVDWIEDNPRPADAEDQELQWDMALAVDELPRDAGLAWQVVDAARRGALEEVQTLADAALAAAPSSARTYQALAAAAAFRCDEPAVDQALTTEALTRYPYSERERGVEIRREYVYREVGLGRTQPADGYTPVTGEMWPWSIIDERPECTS